MIEISDSYKIKRDRYQWILSTAREGKDRHGSPKTRWTETYHASLHQVAKHIADTAGEGAETLDQMLEAVDAAVVRIEAALTEPAGEES